MEDEDAEFEHQQSGEEGGQDRDSPRVSQGSILGLSDAEHSHQTNAEKSSQQRTGTQKKKRLVKGDTTSSSPASSQQQPQKTKKIQKYLLREADRDVISELSGSSKSRKKKHGSNFTSAEDDLIRDDEMDAMTIAEMDEVDSRNRPSSPSQIGDESEFLTSRSELTKGSKTNKKSKKNTPTGETTATDKRPRKKRSDAGKPRKTKTTNPDSTSTTKQRQQRSGDTFDVGDEDGQGIEAGDTDIDELLSGDDDNEELQDHSSSRRTHKLKRTASLSGDDLMEIKNAAKAILQRQQDEASDERRHKNKSPPHMSSSTFGHVIDDDEAAEENAREMFGEMFETGEQRGDAESSVPRRRTASKKRPRSPIIDEDDEDDDGGEVHVDVTKPFSKSPFARVRASDTEDDDDSRSVSSHITSSSSNRNYVQSAAPNARPGAEIPRARSSSASATRPNTGNSSGYQSASSSTSSRHLDNRSTSANHPSSNADARSAHQLADAGTTTTNTGAFTIDLSHVIGGLRNAVTHAYVDAGHGGIAGVVTRDELAGRSPAGQPSAMNRMRSFSAGNATAVGTNANGALPATANNSNAMLPMAPPTMNTSLVNQLQGRLNRGALQAASQIRRDTNGEDRNGGNANGGRGGRGGGRGSNSNSQYSRGDDDNIEFDAEAQRLYKMVPDIGEETMITRELIGIAEMEAAFDAVSNEWNFWCDPVTNKIGEIGESAEIALLKVYDYIRGQRDQEVVDNGGIIIEDGDEDVHPLAATSNVLSGGGGAAPGNNFGPNVASALRRVVTNEMIQQLTVIGIGEAKKSLLVCIQGWLDNLFHRSSLDSQRRQLLALMASDTLFCICNSFDMVRLQVQRIKADYDALGMDYVSVINLEQDQFNKQPMLELKAWLSQNLKRENYRRSAQSGWLCSQVWTTPSPGRPSVPTRYWKATKEFKVWLNELVNTVHGTNMTRYWKILNNTNNARNSLLEYFWSTDYNTFPKVEPKRMLYAFNNGLYCAERNKFALYNTDTFAKLFPNPNLCASKYFDSDVPVQYFNVDTNGSAKREVFTPLNTDGSLKHPVYGKSPNNQQGDAPDVDAAGNPIDRSDDLDPEAQARLHPLHWSNIKIPFFDDFIAAQGWNYPTAFWHYIMHSRAQKPISYDEWQIWFFVLGRPGTAKSTNMRWIMSTYEFELVGIINPDGEVMFGLMDYIDANGKPLKHIMIIMDMNRTCNTIPPSTINSCTIGEPVNVAVKHGSSRTTQNWEAPLVGAGNKFIKLRADQMAALLRRTVIFEADNQPQSTDAFDNSSKRILENIVPYMLKCNFAHQDFLRSIREMKRVGNPLGKKTDMWKHLPEYFHGTRRHQYANTTRTMGMMNDPKWFKRTKNPRDIVPIEYIRWAVTQYAIHKNLPGASEHNRILVQEDQTVHEFERMFPDAKVERWSEGAGLDGRVVRTAQQIRDEENAMNSLEAELTKASFKGPFIRGFILGFGQEERAKIMQAVAHFQIEKQRAPVVAQQMSSRAGSHFAATNAETVRREVSGAVAALTDEFNRSENHAIGNDEDSESIFRTTNGGSSNADRGKRSRSNMIAGEDDEEMDRDARMSRPPPPPAFVPHRANNTSGAATTTSNGQTRMNSTPVSSNTASLASALRSHNTAKLSSASTTITPTLPPNTITNNRPTSASFVIPSVEQIRRATSGNNPPPDMEDTDFD